MGIVICVPQSAALSVAKVNDQLSEVCKQVILNESQLRLIAQPGKLMDVLGILNENSIPYHIQDYVSRGEGA